MYSAEASKHGPVQLHVAYIHGPRSRLPHSTRHKTRSKQAKHDTCMPSSLALPAFLLRFPALSSPGFRLSSRSGSGSGNLIHRRRRRRICHLNVPSCCCCCCSCSGCCSRHRSSRTRCSRCRRPKIRDLRSTRQFPQAGDQPSHLGGLVRAVLETYPCGRVVCL